jgi:hypothetical protein
MEVRMLSGGIGQELLRGLVIVPEAGRDLRSWSASSWQMAAPMPRVPPVTSATRPWTMPVRVDRGCSCPSTRGVVVVIACFLSPA